MGSAVTKHFENVENKLPHNQFPIGKKYWENLTHPTNMRGEVPQNAVQIFENEYGALSNEFKQIQHEQYELFARKHLDYGLNNIALGGDIVNNSNDKKFSLTGLCIRLTDKISRLKNLLVNGKSFVEGEGMEDTFIDIANYGIIGLLVGRDKWRK